MSDYIKLDGSFLPDCSIVANRLFSSHNRNLSSSWSFIYEVLSANNLSLSDLNEANSKLILFKSKLYLSLSVSYCDINLQCLSCISTNVCFNRSFSASNSFICVSLYIFISFISWFYLWSAFINWLFYSTTSFSRFYLFDICSLSLSTNCFSNYIIFSSLDIFSCFNKSIALSEFSLYLSKSDCINLLLLDVKFNSDVNLFSIFYFSFWHVFNLSSKSLIILILTKFDWSYSSFTTWSVLFKLSTCPFS